MASGTFHQCRSHLGVQFLVKNFHPTTVHVLCPMLCLPLKGKISFHSWLHGNSNSVVLAMLQARWAWFQCGNLHFLIAECQDLRAQPDLLWLDGQHQWSSCGSYLTPGNISASLLLGNAWDREGVGNTFNSHLLLPLAMLMWILDYWSSSWRWR